MHLSKDKRSGFTLMELVVTISIVSILAGALTPSLKSQLLQSRDARRITDIQTLCEAIDGFYVERGRWPLANQNPSEGGWDVSNDGDFISELIGAGYLQSAVFDPINDSTYHYRYFVYSSGAEGCVGESNYYVIGIRNFETSSYELQFPGFFECSGRDWGSEFAYVTGAGARP